MLWTLLAIAFVPGAARFRGRRIDASGPDRFACPIDIPTGPQKTARTQGPYFDSLFETLLHGNGQTKYYGESTVELVGCKDGTFQESWVADHKAQYRCLYAMILKDNCGGVQSSFKTRQEKWELTCLDPDKTVTDAYKLMTKKEFKYLRRLNSTVTHPESAVGARFSVHFDMTGYKELACIQMKVIDDDCIKPIKAPRLLPDWYWKDGQPPTPEPHIPKPNTGSKWFEEKLDDEYAEANPEAAAYFTSFPANFTNSSIRLHSLNSTNVALPVPGIEAAKTPSKSSSMYRHLVAGNFSLGHRDLKIEVVD